MSKKAFVIPFPQHGHINPMLSMVHELVHEHNYQVIFYATEEFKDSVSKTGATYTPYTFYDLSDLHRKKSPDLIEVFTTLIGISHKELPLLLEDFEREKPDVIIYDFMCLPAKFLVKLIEKSTRTTKVPISVNFNCSFAMKPNVYPTNDQLNQMADKKFYDIFRFLWLILLQILFSLKFGLNVWNTMNLFFEKGELNLVSVFPELQPKRDKFGPEFKFVGCSVNEESRKLDIEDKRLRDVLNLSEIINPNFDKKERKEILIYASLGTVFNKYKFIFDKIIQGFRDYELKNPSLKPKLIISTGSKVFSQYQKEIEEGIFKSSDNIIMLPYVPQINVLEKASIFITHCGMNSASEAIHYGVPMICLPLKADQPLVAQRLAQELELGIKLEPFNFNSNDLTNGIEIILNDNKYQNRILELARISRKYNGGKNAAQELDDFLSDRKKKDI